MRSLALFLVLGAATASAQTVTLGHSGYVLGASDQPISGSTPMSFAIYAQATDGAPVWSAGACSVTVNGGYYSVTLGGGCGTGLSATHLPVDGARWLEISVAGIALSPRQAIAPAFAAQTSADAQALKTALAATGTLNAPTNPVDWTQLKGVPSELADGVDGIGAAAVGGGLTLLGGAYALDTDGTSLVKVSGGALSMDGLSVTASLPLHANVVGSGAGLTNLGNALVGATGATLNTTLSNLAATGWSLSGPTLSTTNTGNVGIGSSAPGAKLTVAGTIQSTSGGFLFPDGTTQATAAIGLLANQQCPTDQYLRGFDASGNKICVTLPTVAAVTATQLSLNYIGSCAIMSNQQVNCWGYNAQGQLGRGNFTDSAVPVVVHKNDGSVLYATRIAHSGHYAACAIQAGDGKVWCWGHNNYGQLGNGNTTNQPLAVPVQGLGAATEVSGNYFAMCAVQQSDSRVYCWGYNGHGELGNNSTTTSATPVAVVTSSLAPLSGVNRVVGAGSIPSCAYSTVPGNTAIYCWSYNGYGQVGDGTTTQRTVATPVVSTALAADGVTQIMGVYTGGDSYYSYGSTCAVGKTAAGTYKAYCWGYNGYGQLADGTTTQRNAPVVATLIPAQPAPFTMSMSAISTCYLAGTTVSCIGYNGYGQLGDGTTTSRTAFVQVKGIGGSGLLSASALPVSNGNYQSYEHHCAILTTGGIACWGYNGYGNLGNGYSNSSSVPVGVLQ